MTGEGWNELMHSLSRDEVWFTQVQQQPCYDLALMDESPETWRVLKAKCIIDHPNGCGKDVSYPYFVAYTWVITFVILNLVIAVILEGFADSSKDEGSDMIDQCIEIWRRFDTNCDMKLSLCDTFLYIEAVARHHKLKPMQLAELCDPKRQTVDLAKISMRNSNCSNVMVSTANEVHFIHAVRWASRVVMSSNMNPDLIKEMTHVDEEDEKSKSLEDQLARRQGVAEKVGEPMLLSFLIATAKIQDQFRAKRMKTGQGAESQANTEEPCRAG